MKNRAIILGSTGSIGCSSLDVLQGLGDDWEVVGLAAGRDGAKLARQANTHHPAAVAISDADRGLSPLRDGLRTPCEIFSGPDALLELVDSVPCDCVISAVVGVAGLAATLRAVELGRRLALANKETLVMAGALLMPLAVRSEALIIPVDSEHSAIFQALQAGRGRDVHRVYLTASGGPFRKWSEAQMGEITLGDALQHPTWDMGPKITIDSATMMNKALEIVEAHWLFGLSADRIGVVVHPESIIHSLVEFCDGSMIAQLSTPDMRTPIQYALTYPERRACPARHLDLVGIRQLTLDPPDIERFPAIRLGHEVADRGGTAGAVLNAANEAAVDLFRSGRIHFRDIARLVERALTDHAFVEGPTLAELQAADAWARQEVHRCTTC